MFASKAEALQSLSRFSIGKPVQVHYNPFGPEDAVLDPSGRSPLGGQFGLLATTAFLGWLSWLCGKGALSRGAAGKAVALALAGGVLLALLLHSSYEGNAVEGPGGEESVRRLTESGAAARAVWKDRLKPGVAIRKDEIPPNGTATSSESKEGKRWTYLYSAGGSREREGVLVLLQRGEGSEVLSLTAPYY